MAAATIFSQHHRDHAAAMGAAAGKNNNGVANASVVAKLGPSFTSATSQADLLKAAFDLENAAASTYLSALGRISGSDPAAKIAAILPIEARHAVVLGTVGGYPIGSFVTAAEPESNALSVRDYPIGD